MKQIGLIEYIGLSTAKKAQGNGENPLLVSAILIDQKHFTFAFFNEKNNQQKLFTSTFQCKTIANLKVNEHKNYFSFDSFKV